MKLVFIPIFYRLPMSKFAVYIGSTCPPNVEAYLDARIDKWTCDSLDLIVSENCSVPEWLTSTGELTVQSYPYEIGNGVDMTRGAAIITREYINDFRPDQIRQITQPRWHAPGVIAGSAGTETVVETRASSSMFGEYKNDPNPTRSFFANNILGRSIFFSDKLYTPKYGSISTPWWSNTERCVEVRKVNPTRFSPDSKPLSSIPSLGDFQIITVGRISEKKGMDLLLEVSKIIPEFGFIVVGSEQDPDLAQALRERPNIFVHNPVPYIEMPGVYAAADVVLSVSRLEWGGVSRAMLEARATAAPVVALDIEDAASVANVTCDGNSESIVEGIKQALTGVDA